MKTNDESLLEIIHKTTTVRSQTVITIQYKFYKTGLKLHYTRRSNDGCSKYISLRDEVRRLIRTTGFSKTRFIYFL